MGAAMRSAGAVHQPIDPFFAEPLPPLVAGGPRNAHLGGDMGHRSSLLNAKTQGQSANWRESGVSVHLSLLGSCGCVSSTTLPPGAQLRVDQTSQQRSWSLQLATRGPVGPIPIRARGGRSPLGA